MERKNIDISWTTLWRILIVAAAVAIFIIAREAFFAFLLAIVLASAIEPIVSFLEKRKFPRWLAVLMVFIIGLAILAILLYTIIPIAVIEFKDLFTNLEEKLPTFLKPIGSLKFLNNFTQQGGFLNSLMNGDNSFINFVSKVFGNFIILVVIVVLTFYLTVNKNGVEKFLRAILPTKYEERIISIYLQVKKRLGRWLQAQLLLMFLVGSLSFLGLRLLNVNYSLLLGIIAGIFELVPMAGPVIAGVIAFFVALSKSWALALYVVILFVAIQQFENNILLPLVMKKTMGVEPALVVLSLLVGYAVASWMGVLLAVPTAITIQEISEDISRRKIEKKKERPLFDDL